MKNRKTVVGLAGLFAATVTTLASTPAQTAVLMDVRQAGNDVVVVTTGSLDLRGLTLRGPLSSDGQFVRGQSGFLSTGAVPPGPFFRSTGYRGFSGPRDFGPGTDLFRATSSSGQRFGINTATFGAPLILVREGYVSGESLFGRSIFQDATIASLGLAAGEYVFNSARDSITINIGAVPEPASWSMMILGFGLAGAAARRRRAVRVGASKPEDGLRQNGVPGGTVFIRSNSTSGVPTLANAPLQPVLDWSCRTPLRRDATRRIGLTKSSGIFHALDALSQSRL